MAGVPAGARKIAHYFYDGGVELQVFAYRRRLYVRNQFGEHPFDVTYGRQHPHPDDGTEHMDHDGETLGLYYALGMSETGWSGDC